jgi:lipoprotein-releasing system permease protein
LGGRQKDQRGTGAAAMSLRWIWFIASRYIFRKQGKSPSPVFSILGIATGVFALIVIITVMNGFQLGFIESILEVSSYHLRAGPLSYNAAHNAGAAVTALSGVEAAVPFREFQALLRGKRGGQQSSMVRGVPADAPKRDPAMAARLAFEEGFFDLEDGGNILLGAELARRLWAKTGDEVKLFSIPSIFSAANDEEDDDSGLQTFTVTGIFRTGYYEYDMSWAFINIKSAESFSGEDTVLGIKLKNRFDDHKMRELLEKNLGALSGFKDAQFTSWRDYNRAFFGALRTEKLFMFILVGLIFIVVGLNIYQAQRRTVLEHREDIGLLRAIGGGEWAVRLIFVFDGAIIGLCGAVSGLVLGLLVSFNISLFFTIIENIVNIFINIVNFIANMFNVEEVDGFSIFSPAVFYIKEIPARLIPGEAALIFMFGFLSALLAAWFASRKVSRILVAEVLRYE